MEMANYIALGIIQGLTEFLPVSSTGHLVIAQKMLGISSGLVELEIVLHLGTFLAVLIFFFKDLLKVLSDRKLLLLIIIVTLITGAIGVFGNDFFERLFYSTKAVVYSWLLTGIILILTRNSLSGARKNLNIKDAITLGFTQGLAIIPGVSRSGMTISTLLFRKIDKMTSFTFSFLVSLPIILGAAVLKAHKIGFILKEQAVNLSIGFIFSFLFGLVSIWLVKKILIRAKFHYFGYYCIAMAIIVFLFIK